MVAKKTSYEEALKNLEDAVRKLEGGTLGLEESLKVFEEGINWSRQCQQRLVEAEKRVEILLKNEKDEMTQVAFDLGED